MKDCRGGVGRGRQGGELQGEGGEGVRWTLERKADMTQSQAEPPIRPVYAIAQHLYQRPELL